MSGSPKKHFFFTFIYTHRTSQHCLSCLPGEESNPDLLSKTSILTLYYQGSMFSLLDTYIKESVIPLSPIYIVKRLEQNLALFLLPIQF